VLAWGDEKLRSRERHNNLIKKTSRRAGSSEITQNLAKRENGRGRDPEINGEKGWPSLSGQDIRPKRAKL